MEQVEWMKHEIIYFHLKIKTKKKTLLQFCLVFFHNSSNDDCETELWIRISPEINWSSPVRTIVTTGDSSHQGFGTSSGLLLSELCSSVKLTGHIPYFPQPGFDVTRAVWQYAIHLWVCISAGLLGATISLWLLQQSEKRNFSIIFK